MGYANDALGATPTILSPAQFKAYLASKAPAPTVKVQVTAPPITNPILSLLAKRVPTAAVLTPPKVAPPAPVPVTVPTTAPTAGPTTAQNAAPLVAAAAAPIVGATVAATIPSIVDAATEPSPVRIRIAPADIAPVLTPAPSSGGGSGGPELYNTDGSPMNAAAVAATAPGNLLDTVKNLPPAVLAAVLVGGLFILSQRRH